MLDALFKDMEERMKKALHVVEHELGALRTGRASTHTLDSIVVKVYDSETPLNQIATINTPDGSTILVQPWDKNALTPIEKAILQANIGLTPNNDGKVIRLTVPAMTEETRKSSVKKAHAIAEEGRVAVRNIRRHINDEVKKHEKDKTITEDDSKRAVDQIQKKTDEYIKKIDSIVATKEKEIMTV